MTSARKPHSTPSKIIKEKQKRSDWPSLSVVKTTVAERSSPFDASSHFLNGIFQKLFDALHAIHPKEDLLIGRYSRLSGTLHVDMASGVFTPLKSRALNTAEGALATLLDGSKAVILAHGTDLQVSDPAFAPCSEDGAVVLFRADLDDEILVILLHSQVKRKSSQKTMWSSSRLETLQSIIELAAQAAGTGDLSLDVEAQHLKLNALRTELRQTRAFFSEFSAAIRQCFWVLDIETAQVRVVSDNFERIWGASRHILSTGLTGFMANVVPEDRDRVLSEFHTQLGREFEIELRLIGQDSEVRWIWMRSYPTRIGEFEEPVDTSRHQHVIIIADDITDKKTQEEAVRAHEANLVTNAKTTAVVDLASGVAHEINNPLTIIVNKAEEALKLLKEESSLSPRRLMDILEKIQKTSVRISEIIKSLKSLAKQDKAFTYRQVPISKIFDEVHDLVNEKFKSADVRLELPDFPSPLNFEVNDTMISQLILNLLNNAFDAVQSESAKWVKVEWTEDEKSIFLYVTDSGPGIPIKIRSRIFDPFFTTKSPNKGTGLGLALAASIVAHHDGQLRLDTYHPHTRFVIQIPKRRSNSKESQGTGGR